MNITDWRLIPIDPLPFYRINLPAQPQLETLRLNDNDGFDAFGGNVVFDGLA
jgi:hypothetical protein